MDWSLNAASDARCRPRSLLAFPGRRRRRYSRFAPRTAFSVEHARAVRARRGAARHRATGPSLGRTAPSQGLTSSGPASREQTSVDDRLADRRLERGPQLPARAALHHVDAHELLRRLHPERHAAAAGPAERALRYVELSGDGIEHHLHAEAEAHAARRAAELAVDQVAGVVRHHELHRARAQDALARELAAVEQHLRELEVVLGAGGEPAGAGEVHAVELLVGIRLEVAALSARVDRGHALGFVAGEREAAVGHTERREDPLLEEHVVRLARHHLADSAQYVEAREAAVAPQRGGLEVERHRAELR